MTIQAHLSRTTAAKDLQALYGSYCPNAVVRPTNGGCMRFTRHVPLYPPSRRIACYPCEGLA